MKRSLLPCLLVLAACAAEESGASGLLLPGDVQVDWEAAYNEAGDGLGALVPVDVMVFDGATGDPVQGAEVLVWTDDASAWPVPVEVVVVATAEDCGDAPCDDLLVWDASRDQYVGFARFAGSDLLVAPEDHRDGDGLDLVTDEGGIARLYVYVDAFPETDTLDAAEPRRAFAEITVLVQAGPTDETFLLTPR